MVSILFDMIYLVILIDFSIDYWWKFIVGVVMFDFDLCRYDEFFVRVKVVKIEVVKIVKVWFCVFDFCYFVVVFYDWVEYFFKNFIGIGVIGENFIVVV